VTQNGVDNVVSHPEFGLHTIGDGPTQVVQTEICHARQLPDLRETTMAVDASFARRYRNRIIWTFILLLADRA
jgi:hypothetical protein